MYIARSMVLIKTWEANPAIFCLAIVSNHFAYVESYFSPDYCGTQSKFVAFPDLLGSATGRWRRSK